MTHGRFCLDCGTFTTEGNRCAACRRAKDREPGTTTQRGLGWRHQQKVERLKRGGNRTCWLCGKPGSWRDQQTRRSTEPMIAVGS